MRGAPPCEEGSSHRGGRCAGGHWRPRLARAAGELCATRRLVDATSRRRRPTGQAMPPGSSACRSSTRPSTPTPAATRRRSTRCWSQLLRALAPGQPPVLRIGGDSTDQTWWPIRGVIPPGGVNYALTKGLAARPRARSRSGLGAQLIMGSQPRRRPAGARRRRGARVPEGIGRRYIEALEIGNEPDLYGQFAWYRDRHGTGRPRAPAELRLRPTSRAEFAHWRAALPAVPLAGPAFAELTGCSGLERFLAAEPRPGLVTVHRYPLRGCIHDPTSPLYPSIPNLLERHVLGRARQRGRAVRRDRARATGCRSGSTR